MIDQSELDSRIQLVKLLQSKPVSVKKPAKNNKQSRMSRVFNAIDRKHAKPKIQYFPQERRYCFPANIGNARNPLVFGKIPVNYQIRELLENARSNHVAGLTNTNKTMHLERVRRMNYKHY